MIAKGIALLVTAMVAGIGHTGPGERAQPSATVARGCSRPPPPPPHPIRRRQWLSGVVITEYYSSPERLFTGRLVPTPGMSERHRVDWLYSAHGVSMQGDGIDRHGRHLHIDNLGTSGWVNGAGRATWPVCLGKWSHGEPVWRGGGWRNRRGQVTFPLGAGGWSNGPGVRNLSYGGVTFAHGSSLPLHYYRTLATDPRLIPRGSRVYIPAYRKISGGWFLAQDTGGAIKSRHVDVYRPPPTSYGDQGRYMRGQRIFVIPPGA